MLEAKDTLIILPDGPLWYVPYAALIAKDETSPLRTTPFHTFARYLIEDYTINYLPSLEVASSILTSTTTNATEGGFLGIYWQLSWLKDQIEQTLSYFGNCLVGPSGAVAVFNDDSITETQFKSQAPDMSFIALFSPSVFDSLSPQNSYFPLRQTTEDDGILQAQEASALNLANVSLVVLGMTEVSPPTADGTAAAVLVWPQAFLDAVAQTVIQPLWPANLAAMRSIMETLCEAHRRGVSWSQALREAQLDLLADEYLYAPWFWAPYQLIGRWR